MCVWERERVSVFIKQWFTFLYILRLNPDKDNTAFFKQDKSSIHMFADPTSPYLYKHSHTLFVYTVKLEAAAL